MPDPYMHEAPPAGSLFAVTAEMREVKDRIDKALAPAPHNGTPTSVAAAAAVEPHRTVQWRRVYDWIDARGLQGGTRQEVADGTEIKLQSVCARVSELLAGDLNLLVEPGAVRNGGAVLVSRRVFEKAFPAKG